MNESYLRRAVLSSFKQGGGLAVPIEDGLQCGIPDVSWTVNGRTGWLELKVLPEWPKREKTPVRVRTFTQEQLTFLVKWFNAHGSAHLGVRCPDANLYLFDARRAIGVYVGLCKHRFIEKSIWCGTPQTIATYLGQKSQPEEAT